MSKTSITAPQPISEHRWPEGAIVYHIYPRSLQDSNGDGIGDLPGIISRLDYIRDLGANAIWLSPFYPSPMADFGYDVADYCDVDPMFGTLDDFKRLLQEAATRNLKVMVDLVPNHTSDEHDWFKQSRQSKDNPYSDWYVWRDAHPDSEAGHPLPPNNWVDVFLGQSAWQWDKGRQQFYLHSYDKKQPDLNWSNPAVREAIKEVMRFWLRLGVDGFRVDAVYWIAKEPLLSDDPVNPNYIEGKDWAYDALLHQNSRGWPVLYAYLSGMVEVLKEAEFQNKHRFMVTEGLPESPNPLADYLAFYVGMDPKFAAPFNFEGLRMPWKAGSWRRLLKSFHGALADFSPFCVPSYAFGNHDQPRLATRLGDKAARSAALLQLTLPGMIFVYYGDEIGMRNITLEPQDVHDPQANGDPTSPYGRDPVRSPMQWTAEKHAGFTHADRPWLPVSTDYQTRNVQQQSQDEHSFLSLYRYLGRLRSNSPSLKYGSIEVFDTGHADVLGYMRHQPGDTRYTVLINFSSQAAHCQPAPAAKTPLISSAAQTTPTKPTGDAIVLAPHEAILYAETADLPNQ